MTDTKEWTPTEAQEAFKTFGNYILQVLSVYDKYGKRTLENTEAGATVLLEHLQSLSASELTDLSEFLYFVDLMRPATQVLIDMTLLQRQRRPA